MPPKTFEGSPPSDIGDRSLYFAILCVGNLGLHP